ncbi:unnamed protein product [Cuscuta campestris]|uniref:At1g61320/AtMIF1 LRR domain-containing protein n=1 Tax=Cuscuta campestris TaxID=132261 RepID=A0A484KRU9_9ASTE|nr:unnamed protein product [Cuscuta campestris]
METLTLHHLCLDSHDVESTLSGLVNLKSLEIKRCKLPSYLSLSLLTRLEELVVWLCFGLERVNLANPMLVELGIVCKRTVSLSLTGVPNLKVFCHAVHDAGLRRIFSKLPEVLPGLITLAVHARSNWTEYMPENIATFSRLRTLIIGLDHKAGDIM